MKLNSTILLLILFSSTAWTQTQTPVYLSQTITNGNSKGFYRYLPRDYSNTTKNYPLIIWVHGAGQIGQGNTTDLPKILEWGVPKIISQGGFPESFRVNGVDHSFIVISPQFMGWPSAVNMAGIISYVTSNYRVDPDRIYLMGISAGGGGIWDYASASVANSDKIAAMIPFCGTTNPTQAMAGRIAASKLPVWAFHNTHDGTVPVAYSRNWVNYINSYVPAPSPAAKLTEFPVQSNDAVIAHECWSLATLPSYKPEGINIYEWMLQYKRRNAVGNAAPVARAGNDATVVLPASITLNGSTSTDADGMITAYRWRKISGPASYKFNDSTAASTTVSNLSPGTYQFELTVTDNGGATATDNITIIVQSAPASPNNSPVANAGANAGITLPTNTVTLSGASSTDADGSIAAYSWRKIIGPSANINSPSSVQTVVTFTSADTYRFELTVTDNRGGSAKDSVDIIVSPAPAGGGSGGTITRSLRVNIFGGTNPYTNPQWNNWNMGGSLTSAKFNYDDGTASNVNATITASAMISDNGASYATTATACPQQVLRYTSANTSYRTLTFSGMVNTKTYNLEFYAGRANTGNGSIYQIGNKYDTISTDNNVNDIARFTNIVPDNNGRISVIISRIGTWNYLSGFVITENPDNSYVMSSTRSVTALSATAEKPVIDSTAAMDEKPVTESSTLVLYPNPATDIIYLDMPAGVSGPYKLNVVNMNGQAVLQKTGTKPNTGSRYTDKISIRDLPKGMYLLKVWIQNKNMSSTISKLY